MSADMLEKSMRQLCFAGHNARFPIGMPMNLLVATGRFAGPVVEVDESTGSGWRFAGSGGPRQVSFLLLCSC